MIDFAAWSNNHTHSKNGCQRAGSLCGSPGNPHLGGMGAMHTYERLYLIDFVGLHRLMGILF